FKHADLTKANLSGYFRASSGMAVGAGAGVSVDTGDLIYTNLKRTNFQHACLQEANLTYVNLCFSNLQNADLTGATLKGALLDGVDLRGAILTDEQLAQAHSCKRIKR